MSTVQRMQDAMPHDADVKPVHTWTDLLISSFGNLARLNFETCGSTLAKVGQHWERLASARTAEQVIRVHAETLPLMSAQIATYTQGWFDTVSMAMTCKPAHERDAGRVSHLHGLLDDMAWSAKGVDTMLRAISLSPLTSDSTSTPSAVLPAESPTTSASSKKALPAGLKRRSRSTGRS